MERYGEIHHKVKATHTQIIAGYNVQCTMFIHAKKWTTISGVLHSGHGLHHFQMIIWVSCVCTGPRHALSGLQYICRSTSQSCSKEATTAVPMQTLLIYSTDLCVHVCTYMYNAYVHIYCMHVQMSNVSIHTYMCSACAFLLRAGTDTLPTPLIWGDGGWEQAPATPYVAIMNLPSTIFSQTALRCCNKEDTLGGMIAPSTL